MSFCFIFLETVVISYKDSSVFIGMWNRKIGIYKQL